MPQGNRLNEKNLKRAAVCCQNQIISRPSLGSPALAGPLRASTSGLHLLRGEVAQISARNSITTLRMALLSTESELLVLLLALLRWRI